MLGSVLASAQSRTVHFQLVTSRRRPVQDDKRIAGRAGFSRDLTTGKLAL